MNQEHPVRRPALLLMLAALLLWTASGLQAQFSGPAVGTQPQSTVSDPSVVSPDFRDLTLGAGDLLTIRLFGVPDYTPAVRVSVNGTVQLPLIGIVKVAGRTIDQAENLIAERLVSAGMYRNPQVTISITDSTSQTVTVTGEMHGVIPLQGNRRLLDVLAAAGNLPVTASHVITILRPGLDKPIRVDLGTDPTLTSAANIQILPRDTIIISRVGVVYVLGAFPKQGAIILDQNAPLTLMQATALSGGENFEGKFKQLHIIRTEGMQRRVITTDLKSVLRGKIPDPILQANDVVYLPSDPVKAALKSQGLGTILNLASFLVLVAQHN